VPSPSRCVDASRKKFAEQQGGWVWEIQHIMYGFIMITMGLSPSNFLFGSSRSYHCNCHHIWHETTVQFLWVYTIICSSLGQVHIPCYWNFASRKGCACPVPYGDTTWHLRRMSKPNHEKQYSLDFCCALGPSLVTPTNLIEDTRQQILW
jgi:hypothetical protein